jgi:hypothetical protein
VGGGGALIVVSRCIAICEVDASQREEKPMSMEAEEPTASRVLPGDNR